MRRELAKRLTHLAKNPHDSSGGSIWTNWAK